MELNPPATQCIAVAVQTDVCDAIGWCIDCVLESVGMKMNMKMSMKMNMGTRMGMNVTRNEEEYEDEHGVKMKMNMLKVSIRAEVA